MVQGATVRRTVSRCQEIFHAGNILFTEVAMHFRWPVDHFVFEQRLSYRRGRHLRRYLRRALLLAILVLAAVILPVVFAVLAARSSR